ncbi:carboxypeptidase-like regulatory domain-containing protein [Constantimarinum furrinae]|uniref:Uncharacterized protein n=1 Tax=Constantimarinum furrinae TaxID=2562285 RepID=A0A7G8PST8_9FLAO|nr:carboxypeptidase-like regulatory domain-containing protein [Constantimarinum furrinae]QNJ97404.1 hypothetical protein ALE3EI_0829 [Constantimarinum furrinae]
MRSFLLFSLLCISLPCLAQDVTTIAARIQDAKTGEPIEFVNIGFAEKGIGTVSNAEGNFKLTYKSSAISKDDVLQISSIGYETRLLNKAELKELISYKVILKLQPKAYGLQTVVLNGTAREKKIIGSTAYTSADYGYWRNSFALGGEISSVIRVKRKRTKLHNLSFNIIENLSDSILVRVNVYHYDRGNPGKNLLNENIYHIISKKSGKETIPLEDYNIYVDDDIVVSIELVEIYGDTLYFAISASPYKGLSFTREYSQDRWEVYRDISLSFNLLTSHPTNEKEGVVETRPKPEKILLYWDSALGMESRNRDEELEVLYNYIKELKTVEVEAVKFSTGFYESQTFKCKKGKCKELISFLEDTRYNGSSDFSKVLKTNESKAETALLFTNGKTLFEPLRSQIDIPVFVVNSYKDAPHQELQDLGLYSGGYYLNLTKYNPKQAVEALRVSAKDQNDYEASEEIDERNFVYGTVYNESGLIEGAVISVKNSLYEVRSNNNGEYRINAKPGDVLRIEALGMLRKDTLVSELKKLHIPLTPNGELIEEVIVTGKRNPEKNISTPFGMKSREEIGISVHKKITSEDIKDTHTDLAQLLNWGVGIDAVAQGVPGEFKYRFRKFKHASFQLETYAAVVIDGIVYDQNMPFVTVPPIDPQQIESILFLQSAAGTIRYGSAAAYGAIVIETKTYSKAKDSSVDSIDTLLVSGNDYMESIPMITELAGSGTIPDYLEKLTSAGTFNEAKAIYFNYLEEVESSVSFYVDVSDYFLKWDKEFSYAVLSNLAVLASKNPKALKILALKLESLGRLKEAKAVYAHIIDLIPRSAEAYRDMALIHYKNKEFDEAVSLYLQMYSNSIPNVDFTEIGDVVINEFQHLITNHRSQIDLKSIPKELLELGFKQDIRIVFDWTDSMSEFEIQFVDSNNKFFTMDHTVFNSREEISKELKYGYSLKEFIIDDAEVGKWLINIQNLGDETVVNPTYIKYTLFRNYGLPEETQEEMILKLSEHNTKVTLDTLLN